MYNDSDSNDNRHRGTKNQNRHQTTTTTTTTTTTASTKAQKPSNMGRSGSSSSESSSDEEIVKKNPRRNKMGDDSDDDFEPSNTNKKTNKQRPPSNTQTRNDQELDDEAKPSIDMGEIDNEYQIFGAQSSDSEESELEDEDGSKFLSYTQNKDVLLQLYTQNKLSSLPIWDWTLTSKLPRFILSTSAETEATSTTGQNIDFGEKAQLIDASSTIYGYKVHDLHIQAQRLIDKNSTQVSDEAVDEALANKTKKERKKDLPKTLGDPRSHLADDPEPNHTYDILFTEATRNLSTTVGIRTLLCYNTPTDYDGISIICDNDRDKYGLAAHSNQQIELHQQRIIELEQEFGVSGHGTERKLGPDATEQHRSEHQKRLESYAKARKQEKQRQTLLAERIDGIINPQHTIEWAINIDSDIPPRLVEQKKKLHQELAKLAHLSLEERKRALKIPYFDVPLDTSLQMFLYDINSKETQYNKLVSLALGKGSKDEEYDSLEDLLENNIEVNSDVISAIQNDFIEEEDDTGFGVSQSAAVGTRKKPIDPDVYKLHAEKALYQSLSVSALHGSNNLFDDDDGDDHFRGSNRRNRPNGQNSADLVDDYVIITPNTQHPIPFSRSSALSSLAGVMGRNKGSSGSRAVPKSVLAQLQQSNFDVATQTSQLCGTAILSKRQEYDQSIFSPHQIRLVADDHKSKNKNKRASAANDDVVREMTEEDKQRLVNEIRSVELSKRFPMNHGLVGNPIVTNLIEQPFSDHYSYHNPEEAMRWARGESDDTNLATLGQKNKRSGSQKNNEAPALPQKRKNIFDFSQMSVGRINNLPTRDAFLKKFSHDDDDEAYYLSKSDKINQQFRKSLNAHAQNDRDFDAELELLENQNYYHNSSISLDPGDYVQLGASGSNVMNNQNQIARTAQPVTVTFDMDDFGADDIYQPDDVADLFDQHDQLLRQQEQGFKNNQIELVHVGTSAQRNASSDQKNIMERIRRGGFDDEQQQIKTETQNEKMRSTAVDITPQQTNTATYSDSLVFGLNNQLGSLNSSIESILNNQYMQNSAVGMMRRRQEDRSAQKEKKRHSRMDDDSEGSDSGDDSGSGSDSDHDEKPLPPPKPEKPLSLIQLNILRKQRNTHRVYQEMLLKQSGGGPEGDEKKTKSRRGRMDVDSDNSDEEDAAPVKKAKKVTKRAAKSNTIDIGALIRAERAPMTPGVLMYSQNAAAFTPNAPKPARAGKKAMNDDNDDDSNLPPLNITETLDSNRFNRQVKFSDKMNKKLTQKQSHFFAQQQLLFKPTPEIEQEHYQSIIQATAAAAQSGSAANAAVLAAAGGSAGAQNRHLLPRFVSSRGSFLKPLLSLTTRPNVMLPIQIPTSSYQQQTNVDHGVFINLVRAKKVISNSSQQSTLAAQQRLLNAKSNQVARRQQVFASMVADMAQNQNQNQNQGRESSTAPFSSEFTPGAIHQDDSNPFGAGFLAPIGSSNNDLGEMGQNDDNFDDFLGDFDNGEDFGDSGAGSALPGALPDTSDGGQLDFASLQKLLDEQNKLMLQKQDEGDDFFTKMRQGHGSLDLQDELDGSNSLFKVNDFMQQFGQQDLIGDDPFAAKNQSEFGAYGSNDDPFQTKLFNQQEDSTIKHATVSKYFNMRQLKTRLLQKVTKPQLQRVKLVNLKKLIKEQAEEMLRKNPQVATKETRNLARAPADLPNLSREAFQIQTTIQSSAPQLMFSSPDIINTQDSQSYLHDYNNQTPTLQNIQALRGGQEGDCYHTTFRDIINQIQFEYDDRDARSISTFFLSLLILSNETNLELRPVVDQSQISTGNESSRMSDHGDDKDSGKDKEQDEGNKDPLSLGYVFGDFDIFIPLNARETKRQQLQNSRNQNQSAGDADGNQPRPLTPKKKVPLASESPAKKKPAAKKAAAKKGKGAAKGGAKRAPAKKRKEMDDEDDEDFVSVNTSDEESISSGSDSDSGSGSDGDSGSDSD